MIKVTKIIVEMFREEPESYQSYGRVGSITPLFSAAVPKVGKEIERRPTVYALISPSSLYCRVLQRTFIEANLC